MTFIFPSSSPPAPPPLPAPRLPSALDSLPLDMGTPVSLAAEEVRAGLDRGRWGRCGSGLVYATVIGLAGRGRAEPSAFIGWMPPAGVDFGYVWIGGDAERGAKGVGEIHGED